MDPTQFVIHVLKTDPLRLLTVVPSLLLALAVSGCIGRGLGLVNLFHAGPCHQRVGTGLALAFAFGVNGFAVFLAFPECSEPNNLARNITLFIAVAVGVIVIAFFVAKGLAWHAHGIRKSALARDARYAADDSGAGDPHQALELEDARHKRERPKCRDTSSELAMGFVLGTLAGFCALYVVPHPSNWVPRWLEPGAPGWKRAVIDWCLDAGLANRLPTAWAAYHRIAGLCVAGILVAHVVLPILANRRCYSCLPSTAVLLCGLTGEAALLLGATGYHHLWLIVLLALVGVVFLRALPEHRYPFHWRLHDDAHPVRSSWCQRLREKVFGSALEHRLVMSLLPHLVGQEALDEWRAYARRPLPLASGLETLRNPKKARRWHSGNQVASGHVTQEKRPLIIVCASGGGMRAAVWTCHVLSALEKKSKRSFSPAVRLIFGASGGMLGAAHYVHSLLRKKRVNSKSFLRKIEQESLSRLATHFVLDDLGPWCWAGYFGGKHRGDAIENHWADNLDTKREGFTFGQLAGEERLGNVPSLVFSPMLLEDGRRLLFSNLELQPLTVACGREIRGNGPGSHRFSQSAVQARRLMDLTNVSVLSVVRANATFPYVMPIGSVRTAPRRHLVDAGYYDNYGTGLAAAWLQATLDDKARKKWLLENHSHVLVVQIRDGVMADTLPLWATAESTPGLFGRLFEHELGPIRGILGFREAVQLFENDEDLAAVLGRINRMTTKRKIGPKAASVSFEFGGTAALSWFLSGRGLESIKEEVKKPRIRRRIEETVEWLEREPCTPTGAPTPDGSQPPAAGSP